MLPLLLSAARHPSAARLMREGWAALSRLPYRRLICLDTEYRARGDVHRPWCLCAVALRTGEEWKLWLDGYTGPLPFPVDKDTLFIAFVAGAEVATLLARHDPMPARVFDLFQEYRLISNTGLRSDPHSLADACTGFHISMIDHAAKKAMQKEAAECLVWPEDKQRELINYCWEDTLATARLFLCTLARWLELHHADPRRALFQALHRGEVAGALAHAELRGTPFSSDWHTLEGSRDAIFTTMVEDLHPGLRPIYRGSRRGGLTFTMVKFREAMAALDRQRPVSRIETWPLTATGELSTTDEVLDEMLSGDPNLEYLVEVMKIRSKSALLQCEVGSDLRARTPFFPGSTTTGRCAPKAARFIISAPKLFRHVIQARPGRVVISIDYVAQESAIVGVLAGDRNFMAAYYAGDVHLECAKLCNMLRPDATPEETKLVRKEFKICNLAVVYQAGIRRIAGQLGKSEAEARLYMATHRQEFWKLHNYMTAVIEQAMHENVVIMQDGWRRALPSPFNPAAAANAPVQGTAAVIYRRAVVDLHRAALPLIFTAHDSFAFECDITDAADLIATATRILIEAGTAILPGLRLKVSVDASVALPHLAHLDIGALADPAHHAAYLRHLERAERAKRAA